MFYTGDNSEDRNAMFPSNDADVGRNRNCIPVELEAFDVTPECIPRLLVCPFWYFVYRQP